VAAIELLTPLDRLAHELLWVHMVQHLLLVLPAAILLAAARSGLPLSQLIGQRGRRRLRRWRIAPAPLLGLAWAAHVAVVIGWHVPGLYTAALAHPMVHAMEHVTMMGTAVALWAVLLRHDPRGRTTGLSVIAAAGTGLATGAVGVVLVFSSQVVYPWYAATTPLHDLSAIEDQTIAGVLMWSIGGLAYLVATCWLAARWLRALERTGTSPGRRLHTGVTRVVLLLVIASG
jgi:cytochrome c oxidase assembly factor CtaG